MNKTRKILLLAALAIIPAIQTTHAQDITYDWTETGSSYGDVSGTLTISSPGVYASGYGRFKQFDYAITDLSGEFTTGPDAGTTFNSAGATSTSPYFLSPNGFLAFGPANSPSPSSLKGASFIFSADLDGDNFDITSNPRGGGYTVSEDENPDNGGDAFCISLPLAPVPESPVNPAVLAAAGLFIGWRSWRTGRNARA